MKARPHGVAWHNDSVRWTGAIILTAMVGFVACAAGACATGGGESNIDDTTSSGDSSSNGSGSGGGGGGKSDNPSGSTTSGGGDGGGGPGSGGAGNGSGSGGSGGDPGPTCSPPEHMCGGICVGNTPATGCYQSVSCTPCPNVTNGSAICSMDGNCDVMCNAPYVPQGLACVCPTQCCSNADCGSNANCVNGTCEQQGSCDPVACAAICLLQMAIGICQGNQCICI